MGNASAALCDARADELATQAGADESCTALVRLDFKTLEIRGHTFVCGPHAPPTEAQARAAAKVGRTYPLPEDLLSGPAPADAWVFQTMLGDLGSSAAVSALSGQVLFSGWLGYDGSFSANELELGSVRGRLDTPTSWSTADLGSGCAAATRPPVRGVELRRGSSVAPKFDDAANRVLSTALPEAFERAGALSSVVVVAYPGLPLGVDTPGMPPKIGSEYIVMLSGSRD
jgi:hypothetical protein